MRISENVAKRCLGGLTICLAATFFGVPEARAQTLPGLERSAQEAPTPTDPTSSEAIEARLTSVRDEITAVGQAVANAEPDLAEHLRRLREGLRAVETLLAQQIEALEPRPALVDEPAAGQPGLASPFALHALYELQFAQEQSPEVLAKSRDALARAKEQLDSAAPLEVRLVSESSPSREAPESGQDNSQDDS